MKKCFSLVSGAIVAFSVASIASGQYSTGFETADGINASPSGTVLTGQDAYYIPTGTNSIDYLAYTYAGNTHGFNANSQGGDQFVAVEGPGSPTFGRAQRDINWGTTTAIATYDVACIYTGQAPASNNLGSFSTQPYPGSADYIHLFTYVDVNTPDAWQAYYLAYNAAGTQYAAPGAAPGPEWTNLSMNHWYRFTTEIDFTQNRITRVSITDLTTNVTTIVDPVDFYLEGGMAGGRPITTGFRMFSGGGTVGNVVAFDNMDIALGGSGYTLSVTGACPGQVTVAWSGAGSGQQGLVIGNNLGSTTIPGTQPCAGTVLGIAGNVMLVDPPGIHSTQGGAGSFNGNCPGAASGKRLQLVKGGSCITSNVAQLP